VSIANHWWEFQKPDLEQMNDRVKYRFPKPMLVPMTDCAREARHEADKYFTERYNMDLEDEIRCAVYGRGLEHVNKWSLLMACSEDPYDLSIKGKHIEAALKFVRYQIKTVLSANEHYVYKNEDEKNVKRVIQVLKKLGGQGRKGDLLRGTGYSKRRLDEVLSTMEESGIVTTETAQTSGAGRPPVIVRMV